MKPAYYGTCHQGGEPTTGSVECYPTKLSRTELKKKLMQFIGNELDEKCLFDIPSFMEMDQAVIHYAGPEGDKYFRVTLTETAEEEYFNEYNPEVPE